MNEDTLLIFSSEGGLDMSSQHSMCGIQLDVNTDTFTRMKMRIEDQN